MNLLDSLVDAILRLDGDAVVMHDHRGSGLTVRLMPPRVLSADDLGLSPAVQALSTEADGIVLVAGGRRSGRSTLLAALVDLINRSRTDHVITAEARVEFVHASRRALISQREAPDDVEALERVAREARGEEPDVLVIDEVRTAALVRDGSVHPAHAWRKAPQRDLLLTALRRDGVDTSTVERYA